MLATVGRLWKAHRLGMKGECSGVIYFKVMMTRQNMEKLNVKKIYRKLEGEWEGDLADKRKKHHRKTIINNKGRVRQYLKREAKLEQYA